MTVQTKEKANELFDEFLKQPDAWKILDGFYQTYGFDMNDYPIATVERKTLWVILGYVFVFLMGIGLGGMI